MTRLWNAISSMESGWLRRIGESQITRIRSRRQAHSYILILSVSYDRLPDLFLAFDLFDRSTSTFLPRSILARQLQDTSIQLTPEIHRSSTVPDATTLLAMIEQKSLFSTEQRREGIYLKVETEEKVIAR
jgi:hypothetical protein